MTEFTGKHLKELREAAGMTIDELTAAVGMRDRRTMFRWHHSEWKLGGKALVAVEHFYAHGRSKEAAFEALALWRDAVKVARNPQPVLPLSGYRITGLDGSGKRVTVATQSSPGDALKAFRAAQNSHQAVEIVAPNGDAIDGFELSARYKSEQDKINE